MTNLYEFLRRTLTVARTNPEGLVPILPEDQEWIELYLKAPMDEMHFQSRPTGRVAEDGEKIVETHFQIAGDPPEIFSLLCEAALANPRFWSMVRGCAAYLEDHVNDCDACQERMLEYNTLPPAEQTWQFKPIKHTDG